jgi:cytochrome d ubiquinol oxidase subunit II
MFPNLVVASADSIGASITVATAASSDLALGWMTGIACVGVPLVLVYHVFTYRTFRGRLRIESEND